MDLRRALEETLLQETAHSRRLVKVSAIVCESLRRQGLDPVVVGDSAIEIHAPDAYTTSDIDLVVPERFGVDWNRAQEAAFRPLALVDRNRQGGRPGGSNRRVQVLGGDSLRAPGDRDAHRIRART
jgi:hypothetical protein